MDNNFDNNTPDSNAEAKPETTYTDPNAGATYTYGAVPKQEPVENTVKEKPEAETASQKEQSGTENVSDDTDYRQPEPVSTPDDTDYRQPEPAGTSADAGYQQPEAKHAQTDAGYQQTYDYGSTYAGGPQQNQGYSQPNTGYQNQGYSQPNTGYQNQGYRPDYQYQNTYQNPGADGMDDTPLSMGEWLLTLLAAVIPCAGLILYCIWAFGKTGNIHRRNFCRASLILQAISIVLGIVFLIFITFAGISSYSYYY